MYAHRVIYYPSIAEEVASGLNHNSVLKITESNLSPVFILKTELRIQRAFYNQ